MDDETRALVTSVRSFLDEVVQTRRIENSGGEPTVGDIVRTHLGSDARRVPVVLEEVPPHQFVDLDIALTLLAGPDHEVVGVGGGEQRGHQGFGEFLENTYGIFPVGPIDRVNLPTGPDTTHRAVAFGIRLFGYRGTPVAVLQRMPLRNSGYPPGFEIACADEDLVGDLIAEVRALMLEHSVLRGKVISFAGSPFDHHSNSGITFVPRPTVAASDVVLPAGSLDRITRHVVGVGEQRERLVAAGQHLKRGVLLYGPPGTGKTLTVRHLVARTTGTTVVLLSGRTLHLVTIAAQLARAMQPALVVLEDCDLVAEDRGMHDGGGPQLFELLDAMDGLDGDADVAFLLTTNRADLLERALAQRPGRVDLAVEIPLPDEAARRVLFRLYARGLDVSGAALDDAAALAVGVTASFAKELMRRAVLIAADDGHAVGDPDVRTALAELLSDAESLTRSLLGGSPTPG